MTKVKICGTQQVEHIVAAADAGADFIGIIFAPSRRQVPPEQARKILDEARTLRPSIGQQPKVVGVFVNAPAEEVNQVADYCSLDMVQLHGDEDMEFCETVNRSIFKVLRIKREEKGQGLAKRLEREMEAILEGGWTPMLDTASTGPYYGGSGTPFDWSAVSSLSEKYNFVLSGGLNPENVAAAIQRARPWAVDVSSGVETHGVKDPDKIRTFIKAVAEIDAHLGTPTVK